MDLPRQPEELEHLRKAIRSMRDDPRWAAVKDWVKSELQNRDRENRMIGYENKSSEAKCLDDFLENVAACEAPEADSDTPQESGAESVSALLTM